MKLSVRAWKESRPGNVGRRTSLRKNRDEAAFTDTSLRLILPVEIQSCAFGERCSRYGLHARGVAERTMSLY